MNKLIWSASLALGLAATLHAEVVSEDEQGFRVEHQAQVPVPADEAHRLFVTGIGQWWSSSHSFSGDATNMRIEDQCFCETWDGNRVEHLRLVNEMPGKLLRFKGGLGPLQGLAVTGSMDVSFTEAEAGTAVKLVYTVAGPGLSGWAGPVDGVLAEQLEGYRRFATPED